MSSIPDTPKNDADLLDGEPSTSLAAALDASSIEVLQAVLRVLKAQREARPRSKEAQK